MRILGFALCLLASACCTSAAPASPRGGARVERTALEVSREFPDVAAAFARMTYDESFAAGGDLNARGMGRLPDDRLVEFARRRLSLLSLSDTSCAAIVFGDADAVLTALDSFSDEDLTAWFRITTLAQSLELAGGPRPMSAAEAALVLDQGLEQIRAGLTPAQAAMWDAAATSTDPSVVCTTERLALEGALAMPRDATARLVRAMVNVE